MKNYFSYCQYHAVDPGRFVFLSLRTRASTSNNGCAELTSHPPTAAMLFDKQDINYKTIQSKVLAFS